MTVLRVTGGGWEDVEEVMSKVWADTQTLSTSPWDDDDDTLPVLLVGSHVGSERGSGREISWAAVRSGAI